MEVGFRSSRRAAAGVTGRRVERLTAQGYRVVRVIWRQLTDEPEALVAVPATALAA